jgi:hypothetical protein
MATMKVTITTGNDAMTTPDDLARALKRLADTLRGSGETLDEVLTEGRILDDNGNVVGNWSITEGE